MEKEKQKLIRDKKRKGRRKVDKKNHTFKILRAGMEKGGIEISLIVNEWREKKGKKALEMLKGGGKE